MPTLHVHRPLLLAAAVCGFTGVLAGTFGAHGLRELVAADLLAVFETGVRYHMLHAIALVGMAVLAGAWPSSRSILIAGWLITIGIIVFSGSLYALAITGERRLGMITPLGGAAFLAGWLAVFLAGWRATRPSAPEPPQRCTTSGPRA
jgi:uncharacterized membrane protein YgdD (TMEM256/DUF423 family)